MDASLQHVARFHSMHILACAVFGCAWPIAWQHPLQPSLGFCDQHRRRFHRDVTPIPCSIWGREGEGWCAYPMSLGRYFALCDRGAFDEQGHTRPVDCWTRPEDSSGG